MSSWNAGAAFYFTLSFFPSSPLLISQLRFTGPLRTLSSTLHVRKLPARTFCCRLNILYFGRRRYPSTFRTPRRRLNNWAMLTYRRTLSDQPLSPTFPLRYEPDTCEYKRHWETVRNNTANDDRPVYGGRLFSGYQARKCVTNITDDSEDSYVYHAAEETDDENLK